MTVILINGQTMALITIFHRQAMQLCVVAICQCAESQSTHLVKTDSDESETAAATYVKAFELINKSSDAYGWGDCVPNPVDTVKAVNYLHALGKDRAIDILHKYQRHAKESGDERVDNEPNQERLCVIIPLLFVPRLGGSDVPSLGRVVRIREERSKQWSPLYIKTQGDLPFHLIKISSVRGDQLPDRDYLVEWAEKRGRLRDKKLRPSDDVFKVADKICELVVREENEVILSDKAFIREQAWRMIEHLIRQDGKVKSFEWRRDGDWNELIEMARKLKIRWSEKEQDYVCG